jgi:predicted GIY-YIG superfamily endonuclease
VTTPFYVRHTDDVASRLQWHRAGFGARHTALRLPLELVYTEEHPTTQSAVRRERQLKRWSGDKKTALIRGDLAALKRLSTRRRPKSRQAKADT